MSIKTHAKLNKCIESAIMLTLQVHSVITIAIGAFFIYTGYSMIENGQRIKDFAQNLPILNDFDKDEKTTLISFFYEENNSWKKSLAYEEFALLYSIIGFTMCLQGTLGVFASFNMTRPLMQSFMFCNVISTLIAILICCGSNMIQMDAIERRFISLIRNRYSTTINPMDVNFTKVMDILQSKYECCGYNGRADYENSYWASNNVEFGVPQSCCSSNKFNSPHEKQHCLLKSYKNRAKHLGCYTAILNSTEFYLIMNCFWGIVILSNVIIIAVTALTLSSIREKEMTNLMMDNIKARALVSQMALTASEYSGGASRLRKIIRSRENSKRRKRSRSKARNVYAVESADSISRSVGGDSDASVSDSVSMTSLQININLDISPDLKEILRDSQAKQEPQPMPAIIPSPLDKERIPPTPRPSYHSIDESNSSKSASDSDKYYE